MRGFKTFAVLVALPCAALLGLWLVKHRESPPKRVSEAVGEDTLFLTLSEPWQRRAPGPPWREYADD